MSKRTLIANRLNRPEAGGNYTVAGWVRSTRASGDIIKHAVDYVSLNCPTTLRSSSASPES